VTLPQVQAHFDPDWIGGDGCYVIAIVPPVKQDREQILVLCPIRDRNGSILKIEQANIDSATVGVLVSEVP